MIRPTRAVIDPEALRRNIRTLRRHIPERTRIMGIAKADCYGHDATICIPAMLAEGIDLFGVATAQEAIELTRLTNGRPVVVLPPPLDAEYQLFARHDLETVLSTPEMARNMDAAARAEGRIVRAHLFVDTGMGRNGAAPGDAVELARAIGELKGLELVGIASHFATSDDPEDGFTNEQLARFEGVLRAAHDAGFSFRDIHIANSGGVLNFSRSHFTLVRPGLALYGFHPTPDRQSTSDLSPVLELRTVVANVTRMPAGVSISYSRRYYTPAATSIATLPIGYADGLMRILTNRMSVVIGGRRYPVVGTICMDEIMVDLGPNPEVLIGDEAIVIGERGTERIDGWELALRAETIPYEICTNISKRVPRVARQRRTL